MGLFSHCLLLFLIDFPYPLRYWLCATCGWLLNVLETQYLGFNHIKEIYKDELDFSLIFQECSKGGHKDFFIHDGFLFDKISC